MNTIDRDTLKTLIAEGAQLWDDFRRETTDRHHLFIPCDHHDVATVLAELTDRGSTFLELGSAAGVVTIIADLLGFEAYGIEIEPKLVERSIELAESFGSNATFVEGSFVVPEYQNEIELLSADRITPTDGADAYDEMGLELSDFDVIFCYPWPGEEAWLAEMMRRHARPDAVLLTYDAKEGFRIGFEDI